MSTLTSTTSTTRPSLGSGDAGKSYFETDTNNILVWDGSVWQVYQSDGTAFPYTDSAYSVSYDGTDDYHEISLNGTTTGGILASTETDTELTFSLWVKPLVSSTENIFQFANALSSGAPYMLVRNNQAYLDSNFRNYSTTLTTNSWNHLLITRTASDNTWRVYLNGNSSAVVSHSDGGTANAQRSNATKIHFGNGYQGYGNVIIDEVAFWASDQSSNLSTIYNSGSPGNVGSLLPYAWWRMGDNDSASNGATAGNITNVGSSQGSHDAVVGNGPTYTTDVA